jgi:RNA polymerase sigma-70 factor (ECF subfamily)
MVELHVTPDQEPTGAPDTTEIHAERDRLERLLGRLPIDQRAVIVLHFYVGLPLTDAADALGIPHGTAKSRLNRGLVALRSSMSAEPDSNLTLLGERPA